jgi:hypothetical protein
MAGRIKEIIFTANQITGDCWRILTEQNGKIVSIQYGDKKLITPYPAHIVDNLTQLFTAWKRDNIDFPTKDAHIRLDRSIKKYSLESQVDDLNLNWLENNFDNLSRLCKLVGIIQLVIRLFLATKLSFANVKGIFEYYLVEKKHKISEIETAMNWLEAEGHITTNQKDGFWNNLPPL